MIRSIPQFRSPPRLWSCGDRSERAAVVAGHQRKIGVASYQVAKSRPHSAHKTEERHARTGKDNV
jgi:hypothetical protein